MRSNEAKRNIPILMYHSISSPASTGFRACTVSPAAFDEHLSYLKQHRYESVTITQFAQAARQGRDELPPRPVILTFDDGYADFFTHALPALQRHGFTATLYVTTSFVGGSSRWLKYSSERNRPMLTWEQLAEISANGIECGAHTHTHPALDMLPPALAREEIARSKDLLEQHLGRQVPAFAYPYGYYSATVRQIVQELGFASACAIKRSLCSLLDNPYTLSRLAITADTSMHDFAEALTTGRGALIASPDRRLRIALRRYLRSSWGRLQYRRNALHTS